MGSACFTKSADQGSIRRFQEPQRDIEPRVFLQLFVDCRKFRQSPAFANIDNQSGLGNLAFRLQNEFAEFAQQTERKIIDAEETAVLESAKEGSLPRAAQAGENDE